MPPPPCTVLSDPLYSKGLGHQFSSGNSDGDSDAGPVDSMDPDVDGGLWKGSSGDFEVSWCIRMGKRAMGVFLTIVFFKETGWRYLGIRAALIWCGIYFGRKKAHVV